MKKVLSLFIAVVMFWTGFSLTVFAWERDGFLYAAVSEQEKTCKIVGCDDGIDYRELTIPAQLDGYTVTSIEREAFCNMTRIEYVKIPDTVKYIGRYAFYYCTNLVSVTIPNGVIYIDDNAFLNCPSLRYVAIPSSVTSIEYKAFGYWYDAYEDLEKKVNDFTIIGAKGSAAENYAKENDFRFISFGNINSDADVTAVDARWALQAASGTRLLSDEQTQIADVNGDGQVTAVDARWILQAASGTRVL